MLANQEFKELLNLLEKYRVKYLVVGGYAVMRYAEPRFTKDLDLFILASKENAQAIFKALKEFGAPLNELSPKDFSEEGYFYQMGKPPLRVDILMSIPGIKFEPAWENREILKTTEMEINFISKEDLMKAKKASGRPQDLLDLENLKNS